MAPAIPATEWLALSREIAAPWPGLQRGDGTFPDYVHPDGNGFWENYAESFLGYALLMCGHRDGDPQAVAAGLRGLAYVAGPGGTRYRSVFEHYAMARGYRLARLRFGDHVLFKRHRRAWEDYLRQVSLKWLGRTGHNNQHVVEAAVVFELLASGLRSRVQGAILGGDRARATRLARDLINRTIPKMSERWSRTAGGAPSLILSDPTAHPIAYHSLSLAFYARCRTLMGDKAAPQTAEVVRRMAQASSMLAAPNGDLAYFGRSQEQSWALSFTAYGAELAARLPDTPAEQAARFRGLVDRALGRLRALHAGGPYGLWITPAFRTDRVAARAGVDVYVWSGGYVGLTLAALNWAVGQMEGGRSEAGPIGADAPGATLLGSQRGVFALVRAADSWLCVKQARPISEQRVGDLRFDTGLVAMKHLREGTWRDLLRLRPITAGARDSAGPHLRRSGVVGLADGTAVRLEPPDTVVVEGGFRKRDRGWLRDGVEFRVRPVPGGGTVSFPARAGDRLQYSIFFAGSVPPEVDGGCIRDGGQRACVTPAGAVAFEPGYASGTDPKLVRARVTVEPQSDGPVEIAIGRS